MPFLGFTEQRLNPYPPLAQRLLVGEGAAVALDPIHIVLLKVAQNLTARLVVGALRPQRAAVAGTRLGLVEDLVSGGSEGLRPQEFARRALVEVLFGIVGELLLAEVGACLACTIDDVVGVVAEMRAFALPAFHRRAVGIGPRGQEIRLAPVPSAFLLASLASDSGDPVVFCGVFHNECLIVGGR